MFVTRVRHVREQVPENSLKAPSWSCVSQYRDCKHTPPKMGKQLHIPWTSHLSEEPPNLVQIGALAWPMAGNSVPIISPKKTAKMACRIAECTPHFLHRALLPKVSSFVAPYKKNRPVIVLQTVWIKKVMSRSNISLRALCSWTLQGSNYYLIGHSIFCRFRNSFIPSCGWMQTFSTHSENKPMKTKQNLLSVYCPKHATPAPQKALRFHTIFGLCKHTTTLKDRNCIIGCSESAHYLLLA